MRILVGMSGGLDSTYAALKLIEEGHEVEGAVAVMHEYTETDGAKEAAEALGIPLHEIDAREEFLAVKENFVEEYIRKIAHFTEYGLLGIELAVYLLLLHRRRPSLFGLAMTVPFFVGFIDESIQSLSGRGPLIEDVWIDIGGFATFYALTLAVGFSVNAIIWAVKTIQNKRGING